MNKEQDRVTDKKTKLSSSVEASWNHTSNISQAVLTHLQQLASDLLHNVHNDGATKKLDNGSAMGNLKMALISSQAEGVQHSWWQDLHWRSTFFVRRLRKKQHLDKH